MSEDLLKLFRQTGALLDGHFVPRSGSRIRQCFCQCALLLLRDNAAEVCGQLADKVRAIPCGAVIVPAIDGIVVGQEVGRSLGNAIFSRRKPTRFGLKPGRSKPGAFAASWLPDRFAVMKFLCIALVGFALVACNHSPPKEAKNPSKSTAAVSSAGRISAEPNPVPPSPGEGQTTIKWNTGSTGWGEVYVSKNGRPEQLFAGGTSGGKLVKWIHAGARYEFRLYEGKGHHKVLGKVEVPHHS